MTAVSRRNFVALASASAILGAGDVAAHSGKSVRAKTGASPHHGRYPYEEKPDGVDAAAQFEPQFLSVVYLKFGKKNSKAAMIARHGYAEIDKTKTRQEQAESELMEAKNSTGSWKRANDPAGNKWRRENNLEKLDFDSPNAIFILLDHDPDEFRFDNRKASGPANKVKIGAEANLVRFTAFGGQADKAEIYYDGFTENNAFVNARLVDAVRFNNRKLLCIDNWFVDADGKPLNAKSGLRYSMNLHILATTEGGTVIPIIIDPDTGNGMGNAP